MIELKNISKTYYTDTGVSFRALSNVSLNFDDKGLVFVLGKSGSGKSTLLNVLGALDNYDSGEMWVGDKPTKNVGANMLDYYRNTIVGFVFQEFNLIESLSVMENVKFALDIKTEKPDFDIKERVLALLDKVGIKDKAKEKARNLSGGQRQRVAIARALIKEPQIILADEPTGSLDSVTGQEIIEILREIANEKLVIVVTHDIFTAAKYGDRIIELKDGKIYRDVKRRKPGESIMASGIDIVSNTIVRLNKNTEIDEYFTARVNEIIDDSGRKTYLNIDTDENKMKALFPNLRDAVKIDRHSKQLAAENGDNGVAEVIKEDDFIPYINVPAQRKSVEFKRSKIAIMSAFKMGAHNLRLKKFRLALIIIVTCIAFSLFGIMNTLSETEMARALAATIEHDGIKAVSVSKNYTYYTDGSVVISDDFLKEIKLKYPKSNFYKQHFMGLNVSSYNSNRAVLAGYSFAGFMGITEIDYVNNLGYKTIGDGNPEFDDRSVVISSYAAGALIKGGVFGDTNLELKDIIGEQFNIDGFEVTVCDIIESDFKPYTDIINETKVIDAYNIVFQLFVNKDSDFLKDFLSYRSFRLNVYINTEINGIRDSLFYSNNFFVGENTDDITTRVSGWYTELGEDGSGREAIYLLTSDNSSQFLNNVNAFNASQNSYINIGYNANYSLHYPSSGYSFSNELPDSVPIEDGRSNVSDLIFTLHSSDYYIKGYIKTNYIEGVALSESAYREYIANYLRTTNLLISINGSNGEKVALLRELIDNDMQVNAYYSFLYVVYLSLFLNLKDIITGAVIFLSLLACLLTYNFISTSIRLTKRNIGLMRALGVKKLHTFFVYVMEGLTVAGITFIVSLSVLLIVIPVVNAAMSATVGFYLPIMLIVPSVYLRMAALSLGVSVLATFVPWFKFAKITPVEAISNRTNEK